MRLKCIYPLPHKLIVPLTNINIAPQKFCPNNYVPRISSIIKFWGIILISNQVMNPETLELI